MANETFVEVKGMLLAHFVRIVEQFKNEKIVNQTRRNPKSGNQVADAQEKWELNEIQEFRRKLTLLKQGKQRTLKKGK